MSSNRLSVFKKSAKFINVICQVFKRPCNWIAYVTKNLFPRYIQITIIIIITLS